MATLKQAKAERQHKSEAEARSRIGRILRMAPSPATPKQQAEDGEVFSLLVGQSGKPTPKPYGGMSKRRRYFF